ncbi:MAG: glycosyltransferase family 2 protein, partial [Bacteroidota bacterium]|nr:glycosyltransferase family 2 protein [Bacteroidota bacterium]
MYKDHAIAIVIPCYNEETQIENVIRTMPDFVDEMIVVDDQSRDQTVSIVKGLQAKFNKITLIEHTVNQGVGGAIASGYIRAKEHDSDIAVVMAGDGQMDPKHLPGLLDPVINEGIAYTKTNRLFSGEAYQKIPKTRYWGNSILSLLTKIASGYWHIADSQSGYTAINKEALHTIDWDKMYKRYGQPNDLLVRLNIYNFKVRDITTEPVYNVGEQSKMKIPRVIFTISILLLRLFFYRLKEKYVIRDFHPLVFFYMSGFVLLAASIPLLARFIYFWIAFNHIPKVNF